MPDPLPGAQDLFGQALSSEAIRVSAIYTSAGHNFFGHNGREPGHHAATSVAKVECVAGRGLRGDRFWDYRQEYSGQVTFFSEEVHAALQRELRVAPCSAAAYRRNLLVRGADLRALAGQEFTVQGVRFLGVAEAKPCHWMNEAVGAGAESWLKGRGGLRAKILSDGWLEVDLPLASGLLLAGGRSRRMGRDKAGLEWKGATLGAHQAATLAGSGAWPLLLSCRSEQTWSPAGFVRREDRDAAGGVLGAFVDAFAASESSVSIVLAVDLPNVPPSFLENLALIARAKNISVVPRQAERGTYEPFAAAWHRSALPQLLQALKAGHSLQACCATLETQGLLEAYPLSPAEAVDLANLNTPADLSGLAP